MTIKNIINWLDKHLLFILSTFLFIFIPLYPKIPLAEIIPGYIVKIRLEDTLIALTGIVWLIQLIRKKIVVNTIFFWMIIGYGLIGVLSLLSGIFLLGTIPKELLHIGKSGLHFFRYLEYFSLFIFAFSSIKTKLHLKIIFVLMAITVGLIFLYGLGQKYSSFPVYSTMNREYSKGVSLQLGENARVQSTFGGHYDMAAYLVITLPILLAFTLFYQSLRLKLILIGLQAGGIWLLLVGASKTSFIAYILANTLVFFLYLKQKKQTWRKLVKYFSLVLPMLLILTLALFVVNKDMANKLVGIGRDLPIVGTLVNKISPTQTTNQPDDFYIDEPIYAEKEIILPSGDIKIELVEKEFEWSKNALKYGISMGIRLDTLWPQAITGLRRNAFFGAGFAAINKNALQEFTEQDSTDNNYLRVLGEIGIIGFVCFYGLIWLITKTLVKFKSKEAFTTAIKIGFYGSVFGLLVNAFYIDVFAASKVAFTFWFLAGAILKGVYIENKLPAIYLDKKRLERVFEFCKKTWPLLLALVVFASLTYRNPYMEQSSLTMKLNYENENYQHLTLAKCLAQFGWPTLCRDNGLSANADVAPLYAALIAPIYLILNNPHAFYFVNFILGFISIIVLFFALKEISANKKLVIATLLLLLVFNPYWRSLTFTTSPYNLVVFLAILLIFFISKRTLWLKTIFNKPISMWTLILLGTAISGWSFFAHTDPLLKDFSYNEKTWSYQMIYRANAIFHAKLKERPFLITSYNPYIIDNYANGNYNLLPFSPNQVHINQAKNVWGDYDFTNLTNLYQSLLEQKQTLYFTDYGLTDFKNLRQNFSTHVINFECERNCNFYTVEKLKPLSMFIDAQSFNEVPLPQKTAFNFTVVGHTHNTKFPMFDYKKIKPYNFLDFMKKFAWLERKNTDFMIFMGDIVQNFSNSNLDYFDRYFISKIDYPLINVKDSSHRELKTPDQQTYKIANNYFVNLNLKKDDKLNDDQRMYLYNFIYDLENATVKNVFIFNFENMAQNPDFVDDIVPRLHQLSDKRIYLISGDQGLNLFPDNQWSEQENLVWVTTGFGNTSINQILDFTISDDGAVTIKKIDL